VANLVGLTYGSIMLVLTLAFNKPLTRWMRQFKAAELMTKESMSSFDLSFDMLSQIPVEEEVQ